MTIDVIVFGNVPLASWVIGELKSTSFINLLGVVTESCALEEYEHHGSCLPPAYHYCKEFDIPILEFEQAEEVAKEKQVLGISVRYNKIFKKEYFSLFKPGIVNLHGGELPRYRGSNIANYVILNGDQRTGGTIHFISDGIDEGDIVTRNFTALNQEDTAYSVFQKTIDLLKQSLKIMLKEIELTGKVPRTPQAKFIENGEKAKTYRSKGLESAREVRTDDLQKEILSRKVRAFHFPKHEPAYIRDGDLKIKLCLD